MVASCFGGIVETESEFRMQVVDTRLGDFTVELDSQYAHAENTESDELADQFGRWLAQAVGTLSEPFVPIEIVSPPIEIPDLPGMDEIVDGLRALRAKDTKANIIYGFGLQLNPEAPSLEPDSICAHLQAYTLLQEWLRRQIDVDPTRRLLPYANPYPDAYGDLILAPDYAPSQEQLIADYLDHNPTRNRELDMLPLFRQLDAELLEATVDTSLVKPRPTYHYRLPDCRLSDSDWGVSTEWNRWVAVERLADNPDARARLAAERSADRGKSSLERLRDAIGSWIDDE